MVSWLVEMVSWLVEMVSWLVEMVSWLVEMVSWLVEMGILFNVRTSLIDIPFDLYDSPICQPPRAGWAHL